jgi:fatty-acid peroxygenase
MTTPRLPGDSSIAFLAEGYRFGMHRFDRLHTDAFRTHLLAKPVTFLRGASASEFFYEGGRFSRDRALPKSVLHSLQDEGSVQTLEGREHHHRKGMFLDLMGPDAMGRLREIFADEWHRASRRWALAPSVVLQRELYEVLTRSVCQWAGVPLAELDVRPRAREFGAMIRNAGAFGIPNWVSRAGRLRTEAWAMAAVDAARSRHDSAPTVLAAIAGHRSTDGAELPTHVAATELLNVLRPMVAVGRFIVFAAWALNRHPEWHDRFASGDEEMLPAFVQEVRRFSPFFPVVGGRATRSLEWNGTWFDAGDWVMLDLFATNRDKRLWDQPELFRPERFAGGVPDRNALVPQGGGIAADGHRCPGEEPTFELIAEAVRRLTAMRYSTPPQDLRVSLRTLPSEPRSGFRIADVAVAERVA